MGMQDVGAEMAFAIGSKQDEFFLNFWGMEKEKKLKNDLHQSQEVMFKAKSNALPHQNVYLAGSYKETYLGDGWKSEGKDKEGLLSDNELDAYELLYGLSGEKVENEEEKLLSEKKIKVTYEGIRTKTAFIPAKMESLVKVEGKNSLEVRSDGMFFSKRQRRGSDYLVTFLEMNTESEWFQNRVREMEHFSYQKDRSMSKEAFLDQYRGIVDTKWLEAVLEKPQLNEQLKKRNEQIYETYTTLPKSLPERVKQLTLDVTQNAQTRYDKLKCIEAYLKTYHYTEAPGEMPNGNDFVDYFLFESQEGYCTYFASAMAVMARSIGIPTRYVEGFIVDYSQLPKGEKTVLVNGRQAHAWVEAYLDRI